MMISSIKFSVWQKSNFGRKWSQETIRENDQFKIFFSNFDAGSVKRSGYSRRILFIFFGIFSFLVEKLIYDFVKYLFGIIFKYYPKIGTYAQKKLTFFVIITFLLYSESVIMKDAISLFHDVQLEERFVDNDEWHYLVQQ